MSLYRTLLHSVDNHGLSGTFRRIAQRAAARLHPGSSVPAPARPDLPHPFDLQHHTETGGYIPGEQLVSGSPSDLYTTAYYGISPSTLTQALSLIDIPPNTTFVDLGCGKGRALLVASAFPFAALLGVELSAGLCTIARANAALLGLTNTTILQQDATTITYPDGPIVVYLYHPFLRPVLRRVLANLQRQRAHSAHPAWLLDANPQYPRLMQSQRFLHQVWDHIFSFSAEDAAADRHGTTNERYTLFCIDPPST